MPVFDFLKTPSDSQSTTRAIAAFALDLYHRFSQEIDGNLFFSPFSLATVLGMTWAGARGETARQMAQVLHFTLPADRQHAAFAAILARLEKIQEQGKVALHAANALWPQFNYPFLQEFIDLCRANYGISITALDFSQSEAARQQINAWVADATAGHIHDLIPAGLLDDLTRLVLTNAVYFKGAWSHPFDAMFTQPQAFYSPTGETQVPLMWQSSSFDYARLDGLQVLEMPYLGEDLSMLVLLPDDPAGLPALEARLDPVRLEKWTTDLRTQEVIVFLPRFRSEGAYQLNEPLRALGLPDAFDDSLADFSGMDGKLHWLYIKAVLHKAFVDVNEAGTEAAAATAVVMAKRAAMVAKPTFRADHPFIYLIREKSSGALLFMGRLVAP